MNLLVNYRGPEDPLKVFLQEQGDLPCTISCTDGLIKFTQGNDAWLTFSDADSFPLNVSGKA